MSYESQKYEINKELLEIIRIGHDTFEKNRKKLQDECNKLAKFYIKPIPKDCNIIPQYDPDKQEDFLESAGIIESALGYVEPVAIELLQKTWAIKSNIVLPDVSLPSQETPPPQSSAIPEKEKKTGRFGFLKFASKQDDESRQNPYNVMLPKTRRINYLDELWELIEEYQFYAVQMATEGDFDRDTQYAYLSFHNKRFLFEFKPRILKTYSMANESILAREKRYAMEIVVANKRESFSTRNDQMLNMMQKPQF